MSKISDIDYQRSKPDSYTSKNIDGYQS